MICQCLSQPPASKAADGSVFCLVSLVSLLLVLPSAALAGGLVFECTESALRSAMAGGGTVTFACDGVIWLTNAIAITNPGPLHATVLDGSGHQISLTGMQGVLYVGADAYLRVANLAITNSRAVNATNPPVLLSGAGIFNDGGQVTLLEVTFQGNGAATGGAVLNQSLGTVNVTNCAFLGNVAGPTRTGPGLGGAILNQSGQVWLQNCQFVGNRAAGHLDLDYATYEYYDASGGAIANYASLFVSSCTFSGNSASGGSIPDYTLSWTGGAAYGGAIWNNGTVTIASSSFLSNTVAGGTGGRGQYAYGSGGGPYGGDGGPGGNGGNATGGAFFNQAAASVVTCTFGWNSAIGGTGGWGGLGGSSSVQYSVPAGNGGPGGNGGSAFGAIGGSGVSLTNCSVAFNSATNGVGGPGGWPGSVGYGPPGSSGRNGNSGVAFGGITGAICLNTLVASNTPNGNCYGTITDGSHNLSSDASCPFNLSGLTNADAKLGPLANNGGPTLTLALLSGSPAIDAGNSFGAPFTDQRGFPRPAGSAPDIGAFEYGSMMPFLSIDRPTGNVFNILVQGNSNQWCRLLISSNLFDWAPLATNQIGPAGIVTFQDSWNPGSSCRFYRVVMP
jgi:hypothetical protein